MHKKNKHRVLITGTSRGIGLDLAKAFLDRGDTVFGFSRSPSPIKVQNYHHFPLDISDDHAVGQAVREIAELGGIDVLINGAAIKNDSLSMLTPVSNVEEMLRTNQLGSFVVTKHAALLMKKRKCGRVINLSSVAVPLAPLGTIIYGATKASVEQMTKVFAREFAADDITFNTIGISYVQGTDMFNGISEKEIRTMESQLLKPGSVTLKELMGAVDFYVSDLASKITSQTIYFGGVP